MVKESLDLPERADVHHLAEQTKSLYISQIALLLLFIICIMLTIALIMSFKRPQHIAIIDTSSGKSYGTVTQTYTHNLLEMNLIYYSREFCESFYNASHSEIEGARKLAISTMHPTLVSKMKITPDFYNDSYVKNIKQNLSTCIFDWITIPRVTVRNDPRYTVFCQFRRVINLGGKTYESKHNVIIHWIRYQNIDPMKKPSPIFVLDFVDSDINSKEVKEQLELLTR